MSTASRYAGYVLFSRRVARLAMTFAAAAISAALVATTAPIAAAAEPAATKPSQSPLPEVAALPAAAGFPDPLTMLDGTKITTAEQWEQQRKPELKRLFQHYMYGNMPPSAKISVAVERIDRDAVGGKATMKQIRIDFGPPECPPINLLLFVPNHRTAAGPPPVFLALNSSGNQSVLNDPRIKMPTIWMREGEGVVDNLATEASRGAADFRFEVGLLMDRGYALATFYNGDTAPDNLDYEHGIYRFFRQPGSARGDHEMGALMAWAWGLSRALDYLETDGDVDARRTIVTGHSRMGKAALIAGAFDERFAAVIPHQSGCCGAAPSRMHDPTAESVRAINERFPFWFAPVFAQFSDNVDRLPFDQHCLIALCAPRPVLVSTGGQRDHWSNPSGSFLMVEAARPVYRLLGRVGLSDDVTKPVVGKIVGKELGYFTCDCPHKIDREYWEAFLQYADGLFGRQSAR